MIDANNRIVKLLNITYPLLQGGMAWASDARLAIAVSNAGGFGIIGCAGRSKAWIIEQMDQLTSSANLNVGLNFPIDDKSLELVKEIMPLAIEMGIKRFTMSGTFQYHHFIEKYGGVCTVIPLVGNVMEAKLAERSGAKAIICEGRESGGTIGRLSLFSLLPQVVDAVNVPVIAAGGIADRRGFLAALNLGAEGVQMGTRFLATEECPISPEYKRQIVASKDVDSTIIVNSSGKESRVLRNAFSKRFLKLKSDGFCQSELNDLVKGRHKLAANGDVQNGIIMAGEISGLVSTILPVEAVFQSIFCSIPFDDGPTKEVLNYLKHRPPFLFIDQVLLLEHGIYCEVLSKLRADAWYLDGHYPDYKLTPGSILMEAMSQAMTLLVYSSSKVRESSKVVLCRVDNLRFRREVAPDAQLTISVKLNSDKRSVFKATIVSKNSSEIVSSCEMMLMVESQ